jgi:hypothetical protein
MRLEWVQSVLVEPFVESLLEDDSDVRKVEVRFLVDVFRVQNCGWDQSWVLCWEWLAKMSSLECASGSPLGITSTYQRNGP